MDEHKKEEELLFPNKKRKRGEEEDRKTLQIGVDYSFFFLFGPIGKKKTFISYMKVSVPYFQVYFGMLDALLASEQLPEEYRDRCQVKILHIFKLLGSFKLL